MINFVSKREKVNFMFEECLPGLTIESTRNKIQNKAELYQPSASRGSYKKVNVVSNLTRPSPSENQRWQEHLFFVNLLNSWIEF